MFSRIFSFRLVLSFLVILGIIGGFGVFAAHAATTAEEPLYLDNVSFKLQIVENQVTHGVEGQTQEGASYYTASLRLDEPETLSVGDRVVLGPRGGDVQVSGFGLGLLKTGEEGASCRNLGTHTACDFRYTIPVQRTVMTAAESASGIVVVNNDIQRLLGLGPDEQKLVSVYPFIETQTGERPVMINSKASLDRVGQVLPSFTAPIAASWIGGALVGMINSILGIVASAITELLNVLIFMFIAPFMEALLAIRTYTDQFAGIIYPAWEVFRNLANIIFILAIIATGLATVFRIGGWQAKDILVKLVIGAILINFSLVIAQTVLGVADTIQNQFLPADTGAIRLLADELIVKGTRQTWENYNTAIANDPGAPKFGTFGESVRILAALIGGMVAFVAFVAITLFLAIRIVFLWLLLMTSPLPYVTMVLPVTRNITRRWWSNFIKYAFMTPAMAFMLNLSALIASRQQNIIDELSGRRYANLNQTVENAMFTLGANAIVLVFLFLSLKVASAFGAESGGIIEKVSDKGWRAAVWGPRAFGRGAGRLAGGAAGAAGDFMDRQRLKMASNMSNKGLAGRLFGAALAPGATMAAIKSRREAEKKGMERELTAHAQYNAEHLFRPIKNTKRLWNRARLAMSGPLKDQQERAEAAAKVMDDTQRAEVIKQLSNAGTAVADIRSRKIATESANEFINALSEQMKTKEARLKAITTRGGELDEARRRGDAVAEHRLLDEQHYLNNEISDLRAASDEISTRQSAAFKSASAQVDLSGVGKGTFAQAEIDKLMQEKQEAADQEVITLDKRIKADDQNRKLAGWQGKAVDKTMVDKAKENYEQLRARISNSRLPESFVATDLRQQRVAEKMKELQYDDDFDSLFRRFEDGLAQGDSDLAMAAYQKIEQSGDMPDLLNKLNLAADFKGKKQFIEKYVKGKMGFDHTQAMLIAAESDRRNKANGLYTLSDTVEYDSATHQKKFRDNEEQQLKKAVDRVFKDKSTQGALSTIKGDFAFIAQPDGSKELSPHFIEAMKRVGSNDAAILAIKRGFNPAVARKLVENPKALEKLRTELNNNKIDGNAVIAEIQKKGGVS